MTRVCIVGACGHAGYICKAAERGVAFELCGISPAYPGDPSAEELAQSFRRIGIQPKMYADAKSMLANEKPDVAVIDGIYGQHAAMACEALEAGMHVLCDKPAYTTPAQLEQLEAALQKSDRQYWSMLTSRYDPWFVTARRLVEEGQIGQVRLIDGQKSYRLGTRPFFYDDAELFGGFLSWIAIHITDLALWISGKKCKKASAFASSACNQGHGDLEVSAVSSMELEDGVLVSVRADYLRPSFAPTHGDDRIRIIGTEGSVEVFEEKVYLLNKAHPSRTLIPNDSVEPLFGAFLQAVEQGKKGFISTEASLEAARVSLALTASSREGRTIELKN